MKDSDGPKYDKLILKAYGSGKARPNTTRGRDQYTKARSRISSYNQNPQTISSGQPAIPNAYSTVSQNYHNIPDSVLID